MALRRSATAPIWVALALGLALAAAVGAALAAGASEEVLIAVIAAVVVGAPVSYLLLQLGPAYLFSFAIVLAPFSGNWDLMGVPGQLAPDRICVILGILAVALRAPAARNRPRFRPAPAHWALGLAVAFAVVSAALAGSLFDVDNALRLAESFGVVPFLAFALAPLAFRTRRDRNILLAALVGLGAYLGLTAVFEVVGPKALVFPGFILDPDVGVHFGRARGPFVQAGTNGVALFACAIACAIAAWVWRPRNARVFALGTGIICLTGAFLTMQRSVWAGAVVAVLVLLVAAPDLRRYFVRGLAPAAVVLALGLLILPGLAAEVDERANDSGTVEGRLNMFAAGMKMVEERAAFGFGWAQYDEHGADYLQQKPDAALSPATADVDQIHNVFLSYAVELGLLGLALWVVAVALAVGGALAAGGSADLSLWRHGLVTLAVFVAIAANFTPPKPFPILLLMLWAGVVWAGRYDEDPAPQGGLLGTRPSPMHRAPT